MDVKEQLAQVQSKKVIILGDVMVDSYIWGKVDRISPEAPVPVVSITHTENRLGGAANVVKNIADLGMSPILFSVLGNDDAAHSFCRILESAHIFANYCIRSNDRKTTIKTRIISGNHQILRVDNEQTNAISEQTTLQLVQMISEELQKQDVAAIIFQDYDKGVVTPLLIEKVTQLAVQYGIPVLVDPKKRNFYNYSQVTIFKPNFKEFTEGIGKSCKKEDLPHLFALSKEFIKKQRIEMLMVTLSEHGIFIANKDGYVHIPSQVRHVADVSGAGDTVISTAAACYVAGLPMHEIARIANIAGGLACEQPGVVTINKEQLFSHL